MNIHTKGPGRYCENHEQDGCDKKIRHHDSRLPQHDLRIVHDPGDHLMRSYLELSF
jgi:hypothetical protein